MTLPLKIYKSSAGSGKTFTLVKEYLKLCLPNPDRFRYVAAITFTNAAAAEMKDRILKTLEGLAEGKSADMAAILLSEGLQPADLARAPQLLQKILYRYADFHVSTIDHFFHGIVRAFHKELGLPQDFEINIEAAEALDYAVDKFLQQSDEVAASHKILIAYIREKIANSQSWNISNDLYRIAKELLKDNVPGKDDDDEETEPADIFEFISLLKTLMQGFEEGMHGIATELLEGVRELGLEIEDFKNGRSGAFSFILKSQKENKTYEPNKRFLSGLQDDFEWYKKNDPNLRLIEEALDTFLRAGSQALYDVYVSGYEDYATAREILKNIYTFSVYEEMGKALDEYRETQKTVLISDLTKILSRHIIKEDIGYVYSKVGSRYEHFLIDEFQDTSALQWLSLKPLVENAVAMGNASLMVGDSKQAIYRWRGGSIELIERSVTEIDFPQLSEKHNLAHNYRSRDAVLDFNNNFFENISKLFSGEIAEYELLKQIFQEASQQKGIKDPDPGYVELNFIPKPDRSEESFLIPAREKLLDQIHESLADGYALKDITILVRDKRDATDVANLLHLQNIPFITQDSLSLDHSPAVRLLMSLLTWINRPGDILAQKESIFLYIAYFVTNGDAETGSIEQSEDLLPARFLANRSALATMPLYDLVEELILMFGLNMPDAYLQRFQDAALEYVLRENGNTGDFINWWAENSFTVTMPENQDAIRIITIHKSKGLEFPVVIIPFANWDFVSGRPDVLWVNPEQEPFNRFASLPVNYGQGLKESIFKTDYEREEALIAIDNINLVYVAFTRARHRLYITTQCIKSISESIKNVPQLIKQVFADTQTDAETTLSFGLKTPAVGEKKQKEGSDYLVLADYPVTSLL